LSRVDRAAQRSRGRRAGTRVEGLGLAFAASTATSTLAWSGDPVSEPLIGLYAVSLTNQRGCSDIDPARFRAHRRSQSVNAPNGGRRHLCLMFHREHCERAVGPCRRRTSTTSAPPASRTGSGSHCQRGRQWPGNQAGLAWPWVTDTTTSRSRAAAAVQSASCAWPVTISTCPPPTVAGVHRHSTARLSAVLPDGPADRRRWLSNSTQQ